MSFWFSKRERDGSRSMFSVNMPIQILIALLALAIGVLIPFLGWLLGFFR